MRHEWKPELDQRNLLLPQSPTRRESRRSSVFLQMLSLGARISLKRSAVFCLRFVCRPVSTLGWVSFLGDFSLKQALGRPHDDLLRKSLDVFFVTGISSPVRLGLMKTHFQVAAELLRHDDLAALWRGERLDMGAVFGRHETYNMQMLLADHCGCRHEGVFAIKLSRARDDYTLWTASFVFIRGEDGRPSLAIGGMQGPKGADAKRAVISATRCLGGLRPKDAMLLALHGLVSAPDILAVSNTTHVINQRRRKRRKLMQADLDGYWTERGGMPAEPFGFRLPAPSEPQIDSPNRREQSKCTFWDLGSRFCRFASVRALASSPLTKT
ncbi:DUF535 family protein [Aminobacter ciceronei]|uniref:VirK protein n=1 Tax=Aminobacter ciceronei TaxID=150723 RepID=A0ABR6C9G8_9HYPH|nr:DUF535 family protein [Aminobacter ciceronei]MBA8907887.1 hypothetical protein [Aminobacter ciceronei]MBA9021659.1 hypothetical protein [Aminobacter ciceronei]